MQQCFKKKHAWTAWLYVTSTLKARGILLRWERLAHLCTISPPWWDRRRGGPLRTQCPGSLRGTLVRCSPPDGNCTINTEWYCAVLSSPALHAAVESASSLSLSLSVSPSLAWLSHCFNSYRGPTAIKTKLDARNVRECFSFSAEERSKRGYPGNDRAQPILSVFPPKYVIENASGTPKEAAILSSNNASLTAWPKALRSPGNENQAGSCYELPLPVSVDTENFTINATSCSTLTNDLKEVIKERNLVSPRHSFLSDRTPSLTTYSASSTCTRFRPRWVCKSRYRRQNEISILGSFIRSIGVAGLA